jgi:hypothetical protein
MADTTAANVKNSGSESEWETVVSESGSPITFDVGTAFVGEFLGIDHIVPPNATSEDDEFDQAKFKDSEGNTRVINLGYKLNEALKDVAAGKNVRITRMADVPTKDPGKNDMKDYRVEVAK